MKRNIQGFQLRKLRKFCTPLIQDCYTCAGQKSPFCLVATAKSVSSAEVCFYRNNRLMFYCRIIKSETFGCRAGIHSRQALHAAWRLSAVRYLSFFRRWHFQDQRTLSSCHGHHECVCPGAHAGWRREILMSWNSATWALKGNGSEMSPAKTRRS